MTKTKLPKTEAVSAEIILKAYSNFCEYRKTSKDSTYNFPMNFNDLIGYITSGSIQPADIYLLDESKAALIRLMAGPHYRIVLKIKKIKVEGF